MTVRVLPDAATLADRVADDVLARLRELQSVQDEVHFCLTGGTIANEVYQRLGRALPGAGIDPDRLHLWWGDERWVGAADADRNARQALRSLAQPLLGATVHPIASADATDSPAEAARNYAEDLPERFHLALLGVGPDGHCLSVFPDHPSFAEALLPELTVVAVHDAPKPPPTRVSLTFAGIGRADALWVVAAGAEKADVVARALAGDATLPAAHPRGREETVWYLDKAAASRRSG